MTGLDIFPGISKGLGWGEGFAWAWYTTARLPEWVETVTVFPLQAMDAYPVRRHPVPPDAHLCGPHTSDGNPTLDIYACPWVRLPPLCYEATVYPLQVIRHLHTQQSIDGVNEGREVSALLEACLKVNFPLRPLRLLEILLRSLHQMGLGICVHDAHVMNNVSPIIPKVIYQEVTLLLNGL